MLLLIFLNLFQLLRHTNVSIIFTLPALQNFCENPFALVYNFILFMVLIM